MAYKIFGKEIKDGQYFTMVGSTDVFVFRGTGFKNLRDVNVTISKHKYHKFQPYWLQCLDKISLIFTDNTNHELYGEVVVRKIEYSEFTKDYKVTYEFIDTEGSKVLGSRTLNNITLAKIKI